MKLEKIAAETHLQNVHLMSREQLDKLQSLEMKQDLLEAENIKMRDCLQSTQWRNLDLSHNLRNLENEIVTLKTDNKNANMTLAEKDEELMNEKRKIDHWKREFEDVSEQVNSKQLYVEKLEFEIVELQNLIIEYEEKIESMSRDHLCKRKLIEKEESQMSFVSKEELDLAERKIRAISQVKDEIINQNEEMKQNIVALEAAQDSLKDELRVKIRKLKAKENKSRASNESLETRQLLRKLRYQLEDSERERKSALARKSLLEDEKKGLQYELSTCESSRTKLEKEFISKSHDNLNLACWLKDTEDELQDVLKKYKNSVATMSSQQIILDSQLQTILSLESENEELKEKILNCQSEVQRALGNNDDSKVQEMFKFKVANLKSSLEFEEENTKRLSRILERARNNLYNSELECANLLKKNEILDCSNRQLQRKVANLSTDLIEQQTRESKLKERKNVAENSLKFIESENQNLRSENDLISQRLERLQRSIYIDLDMNSEIEDSTNFVTIRNEKNSFSDSEC